MMLVYVKHTSVKDLDLLSAVTFCLLGSGCRSAQLPLGFLQLPLDSKQLPLDFPQGFLEPLFRV